MFLSLSPSPLLPMAASSSPRPPRTPSKNKYDDKERVVGLLSSLHLQEMVPFMLQLKRCTRGRRTLSLPAAPPELPFHTADLSGALGAMGSPLRDPGSCALSFCSTGSAAALVWVVSRALPGVQLLRLGKRGADHLPATQPIATPQEFYRAGGGEGQQRQQRRAPSPYG